MGKASDSGTSRAWGAKVKQVGGIGTSWVSGLKPKQWFRWVAGDGTLPDLRSRKIMGGTVGLVVVLAALGWFTLGGGATPAPKHNPPSSQSAQYQYMTGGTTHGANLPAAPFTPAKSTTTTTTTTLTKQNGHGTKKSHAHSKLTGTKHTHRRNSGNSST